MKKLLNALGTLTLTASTITSVVACKKDIPVEKKPTNLQTEILDGAEFMSRFIIAARHENLNINVNELLSSIITPEGSIMRLPQTYMYKNEKIDIYSHLANFKKFLAPSLETLDQDKYGATMASYIMGMYSDEFYKNIINGDTYFNDTLGRNGETGFNKKSHNAAGYLAGLNSELSLAQDKERRNLAWGIQDNGALTNYLLHKGVDGAYPGDTRAKIGGPTATPLWPEDHLGGTNFSNYSFYNSIMNAGEAQSSASNYFQNSTPPGKAKTLAAKFSVQGAKYTKGSPGSYSTVDGIKFNEMGAMFAKSAQDSNINGGVSMFASMLENISTTASGSLILGELANTFTPIIVSQLATEGFFQAIGFSLITNLWDGLYNLGKSDNNIANAVYGANSDIVEGAKALVVAPSPFTIKTGIPQTNQVNKDQIGLSVLSRWQGLDSYGKPDLAPTFEPYVVNKVLEVLNDVINDFETSTDQAHKAAVVEKIFSSTGVFGKAYGIPMFLIEESNWNRITNSETGGSGQGAINLIKLVRTVLEGAVNRDYFEKVRNLQEEFRNVNAYRSLTPSQKQTFIKTLGYTGSEYETGSFLEKYYTTLTEKSIPGQKEFFDLVATLKNKVNSGMEEVHTNALQYIFDDKYWEQSKVAINTTSNLDISGRLEFTLKYTGHGDSSSTASSQTKAVEVPQNFNPYQTILDYQKSDSKHSLLSHPASAQALAKIDATRISGKVLGVEQKIIKPTDLVAYDGTGLLANYKPVNFEYKVKWKNISTDPNNPYWVITGIDSFKDGVQFYNIY